MGPNPRRAEVPVGGAADRLRALRLEQITEAWTRAGGILAPFRRLGTAARSRPAVARRVTTSTLHRPRAVSVGPPLCEGARAVLGCLRRRASSPIRSPADASSVLSSPVPE